MTGVLEPSTLAGIAEPTPVLVHGVGIGIVDVSGIMDDPLEYMLPVAPSGLVQFP